MHRWLAIVLVVVAGCSGSDRPSATVATDAICPTGATCVEATGDVDGDGDEDEVVHYVVGDAVEPDEAGIVVHLATGFERRYPLDGTVLWSQRSGLIGVGPLDDLSGDEIVVATSTGTRGTAAAILHLVDDELVAVEDDDGTFTVWIDDGPVSASGFSCDDTDGDGQPELQDHHVGHLDSTDAWDGYVSDHRWEHGRLVAAGQQDLHFDGGVVRPPEMVAHAGVDCPGFARFGIGDVARRPVEPPQPLCPDGARCVTARGDVDGDGEDDEVTHYVLVDADDQPADGGVVLGLAGGGTHRLPFTGLGEDDIWWGGILGIAPIDDLPGDDVVAATSAGMHGYSARILHWTGTAFEEVVDQVGTVVDIGGSSGIKYGGGFTCVEGSLELHSVSSDWEPGTPWTVDVTTWRWDHGVLVDRQERKLVVDEEASRPYRETRCPGVHSWPEVNEPEY